MTTICIYHSNCVDGFGAAWVVRRAMGGEIEFFPATYQDPPPDVAGKDVVMVDFSYKRPVLLEMAGVANSILILDHHKTAAEELVDLPENVSCTFDMEHSGAMLAWLHYFPKETPPPLMRHIEDRDLWRFALPGTREIQAAVFSYPVDFDVWDALFAVLPEDLTYVGKHIERKHFKDVRDILSATKREMIIAGHCVPVANMPYTMASDAGNQMAEDRPFAACYWDTPRGRTFSLRSVPGGVDVSRVAELFGGGGHQHAAGFTVSRAEAERFEMGEPSTLTMDIARVAHEINRAYCQALGDNSQPTWEDAPEWQRQSAFNGVLFHRANPDAGPDHSHNEWLKEKREAGWKYGPVKNPDTKEHPCFVPYEELPVEQQAKDFLFRAVVHALSDGI